MVIEDFDNLRSGIADAAENGMATALDSVTPQSTAPAVQGNSSASRVITLNRTVRLVANSTPF